MSTIVSFSDLQTMLELTKSAWSDYPSLKIIADQVHDALVSFTGRKLSGIDKVVETGYFVNPEDFINLTNLPLVSVSEVQVDGVVITDYELSSFGIILAEKGIREWSVTAKGGFKIIPPEIYRAEMSQIIYEYQNINNLAAKTFTNDGGGVTLPGFVLLTQVKNLLHPFRHISKFGY